MEDLQYVKKHRLPSIIMCGLLCFTTAISDTATIPTYVQKGSRFFLACQVAGLGVHLWYKDGKPIVPTSSNGFHLESDSPTYSAEQSDYMTTMRVTVENADAQHSGEYKCNSAGLYSQRVIVITENMIETNEDEPGLGKILVPGEPLVLQCNTSECPHCTVVWFKDGERVSNIPGHLVIHAKNNSVVIGDATYEDAGTYVCAIDRKQLDVTLNATILVQSKIKLEKFDQSSTVVEGSPLELYCIAKGSPKPSIRWFIGAEEVLAESRVLLQENRSKLLIEVADYADRNHYTCEAFNQFESVNTTVFIRVKDKLAALWPFLGICVEVAILCTIIFVYERRKSLERTDDPDIDFSTENKLSEPGAKGQDVRQRK